VKGLIALSYADQIGLVDSKIPVLNMSPCQVADTLCLKFNWSGDKLLLGSVLGSIRILDLLHQQELQSFCANDTCAFSIDRHENVILSSHEDGAIAILDEREGSPVRTLQAHSGLCCTVTFDCGGIRFATGGTQSCRIWDCRNTESPIVDFKGHEAIVRAICFSPPGKDRIVTGGGSTDQHIKMWDPEDGTTVLDVHTGNQICNLFWSHELGEIISTEGFNDRTITIWNESELKTVASISGHRDRVLYCAVAPGEENAVTLTPKDGLQFWNLGIPERKDHWGDLR
jgi:WD40 repeat protein